MEQHNSDKVIILFILIFVCQGLNAIPDSIKYELYINYGCENRIKKIVNFSVQDRSQGTITEFVSDSSGICIIPNDTSKILFLQMPVLWWLVQLDLDKNLEGKIDTFTIPPIYYAPIQRPDSVFIIGPTYYVYYHCGQLCSGHEKSYRDNGQLWQKGCFKRGNPKKFKTYHSNGILESKIKERLFHGCDIFYDENGILIRKMKYFLFYSHYKIYLEEEKKYLTKYSLGKYK